MSTKMGIWRGALAGAAILMVVGTAGARVIDPTGVTTNDPAAIVLYSKLKVDPNTCQARGLAGTRFCTLTPNIPCSDNDDCRPLCLEAPGDPCDPGDLNCTCNLEPGAIQCQEDDDCLGAGMDTVVQLTNTSEFLVDVVCFYTNANGHCINDFTRVCHDADSREVCGAFGLCVPGWQETDFHLTLTKRQPISWSVNNGLPVLPLFAGGGQNNQANEGSIPVAPEIPFKGELLCVQLEPTSEQPIDRNDLKGEASIVHTRFADIDTNRYNAYGIKAIEGRRSEDGVLNIGGPEAEYGIFSEAGEESRFVGCPNILTLNHFFDGAEVVTHDGALRGPVQSDLTIVPCARDYLTQTPNAATIQFLIYNEYEQRFSTSTSIFCWEHTRLVDIDTRPGPDGDQFSIFSAGVQGTQTGMSRVRSVQGPDIDGYDANGILLLLSEHWGSGHCEALGGGASSNGWAKPVVSQLCATDADCAAFCDSGWGCPAQAVPRCVNPFFSTTTANVQWQGSRRQGDRIIIP